MQKGSRRRVGTVLPLPAVTTTAGAEAVFSGSHVRVLVLNLVPSSNCGVVLPRDLSESLGTTVASKPLPRLQF